MPDFSCATVTLACQQRECASYLPLPPYSPELNPCEQAWDAIKDEISNHGCRSSDKLRDALLPSLKRFREDAEAVLS
jgi:transposase